MSLKSSNEVLNQKVEETMIKVSDLSKHWIEVSEEILAKYWEKFIAESKLSKILAKKTAEEKLTALKELLWLKIELIQNSAEAQAKKVIEAVQNTNLEQITDWEAAEKLLKTIDETNTTVKKSETTQQIKEIAISLWENAKDWVKTVAESSVVSKFFEWIIWLFKKFLWFTGLDKIFWIDIDKVNNVLNQKQIEETKKAIIDVASSSFPWKKEEIEKIVNSDKISKEALDQIYSKIKAWEKITILDINTLIPDLKNIFSKEELKKAFEEYKTKAYVSMKKHIEEKYYNWQEITKDKLKDLEKLIIEYCNISEDNALLFKEIVDKRELRIEDLFSFFIDWSKKATWFSLELISKGIIPVSAIWIDIAKTWVDILKISLNWLWITKEISYEELIKNIWNIEHPELLLWLLYRKWWLLFSILWDITEAATRIWIESITSTNVKWSNLIWNSILWNYSKQAQNFEKIAHALWDYSQNWANIINNNIANLKQIENNYKALAIIQENAQIIEKNWKLPKNIIDSIKNLWFNIWDEIDDITKLTNSLKWQFTLKNSADIISDWSLLSKYGFWKKADSFKFISNLENIARNQKAFLSWWVLEKWLYKLLDLKDIWKVSRLWEKLVYNFDNIDQAKNFASKLKILSTKAPELLWWIVDKLPIITIAWLALQKENTLKSLAEDFKYLLPFVWPIMMISKWWIRQNQDTWEIEILSPVETSMWWILLWLDSIFFIKELTKWWIKWAWWYLIKPLKDIYSIWRWTTEWLYNLWKLAKSWKWAWEIITKAFEKTKQIKKPKLKAIAIIAVATYLWYEYIFNEDENFKQFFDKNWQIDLEKIKQEIANNNISDEEKIELLKYFISETNNWEQVLKYIEINISNNNLIIISNNKDKVKNNWFLSEDKLDLLWLNYDWTIS